MLLRFITIIALFKFMLLLISGSNLDVALYRSLIVFVVLFTLIYLAIFLINIIRENPEDAGRGKPVSETATNRGINDNKDDKGDE